MYNFVQQFMNRLLIRFLIGGNEITIFRGPGIPMNGLLYNEYAVRDSRGIAPTGWHIPTQAEWVTLETFCSNNAGILKETGTTHWLTPNTGAVDTYGFKLLGSGLIANGVPLMELHVAMLWTSTLHAAIGVSYDSTDFGVNTFPYTTGCSIRCVRDSADGWATGETVTDIDGNTYHTVQVGTQIWLVENLATRHYLNGDTIPEITSSSVWLATTSGALCAYYTDWTDVFTL